MRSSLRAVFAAARRHWRTSRALLRPSVLPLWRAVRSAAEASRGSTPRRRTAGLAADDDSLAGRALYELWIERYDRLSAAHRRELGRRRERLGLDAHFVVVLAAESAEETLVRATLRSLARQVYPRFELLLAPPSGSFEIGAADDGLAALASRTRTVSAPPRLPPPAADGPAEYVVWLAPGDLLAEHALHLAAEEIHARPETLLLYSDHDEIDAAGRRRGPRFKPDWDPDLFAAGDHLGPFVVYRRDLLTDGGDLSDEGPAGDASRSASGGLLDRRTVRHLPELLCHARRPAGDSASGGRRPAALRRLAERPAGAETLPGPVTGTARLRWPLPDPPPTASLIVPTRNALPLLAACLRSLAAHTRYPDYEVVVVDDGSDDPACLDYLRGLEASGSIVLVRHDGPFNYSALNNLAVRRCRGEVLCFLNNDVEALHAGWLTELVSQALRPEVGAVGAKLLYPDGTVQHGGVLLGGGAPVDAVAGHLFHRLPRADPGYGGLALVAREVSAVTGACLATRRAVFDQAGGFDERQVPVAFSDVDLCLRIRAVGYRIVWTPFAELRHHESASRGDDLHPDRRAGFATAVRHMRERWAAELAHDPFYNPNLDPVRADFSLAFPPRHERPWRLAPDHRGGTP